VSDGLPPAAAAVSNLTNSRGTSRVPTGPLWASANSTGLTTNIVPIADQDASGAVVHDEHPAQSPYPPEITAGPDTFLGTYPTLSPAARRGALLCQTDQGVLLYVANATDGTVDVFDRHRNHIGSFTDPTLSRDHVPFDLQSIDAKLFVTFVHRESAYDALFAEPEHGFIVEFDMSGILLDCTEFHAPRR
jgi:hypothetical protein